MVTRLPKVPAQGALISTPAQQDPTQDSIVIDRFTGLKNVITTERLAPPDLARAVNIDLDDAGQVHRRRGYTQVVSGNWHSLFRSNNGTVYGVQNGVLGIVRPNYAFTALQSGIGPGPLAYVQVGPDIYFSSPASSGRITASNTVVPWGAVNDGGFWFSPVVNPTDSLPPIKGKQLAKPPMATSLTYYNGRIYLSNQRALWATELYAYNYVDKTKSYLFFETNINVLGAVIDGIWVGTDDAIWFLSGDKHPLKRERILNARVIPGSLVYVPTELIHPQRRIQPEAPIDSKLSVCFLTSQGLLAGLPGGELHDLTETRVLFPEAISSSALFRRQDGINHYLNVSDSGGDPTNAARIGDYVDATIIRAAGAG